MVYLKIYQAWMKEWNNEWTDKATISLNELPIKIIRRMNNLSSSIIIIIYFRTVEC